MINVLLIRNIDIGKCFFILQCIYIFCMQMVILMCLDVINDSVLFVILYLIVYCIIQELKEEEEDQD